MISVRATREGLAGKQTACGWMIDDHIPFVALPSTRALYRVLRILNPLNGRQCDAMCLDVGPWNIMDNAYVFQTATSWASPLTTGIRPQAETGKDMTGRETNGAGIDLGQYVCNALGVGDISTVQWYFLP